MTLSRFTLAIFLTFTLTIAYQVFAAYLTSPENLKYPNPGHYPGEIGPGTFNCSEETINCFWKFPAKVIIEGILNLTGHNIIGVGEIKANKVNASEVNVAGNLEVSGKGNFFELCIQGNCTTFWPVVIGGGEECIAIPTTCSCYYTNCPCDPGSATCPSGYTQIYTSSAVKTSGVASHQNYHTYLKITTCCKSTGTGGGGGGIGGFKDCEIVEKECSSGSEKMLSCDVSCSPDKWLIAGGGKCQGRPYYDTEKGLVESYPKTAGKGGTWHVRGSGWLSGGSYRIKAYALCCNFTGGSGTAKEGLNRSEILDMLYFGSGKDGDVVITSDTTLTRDMEYRNLTIKSGATLNPNGWRIFVLDTLIIEKGASISRDGNDGEDGKNPGRAIGGLAAGGAGLPANTVGGSGAGGYGSYTSAGDGEDGEAGGDGGDGGKGVSRACTGCPVQTCNPGSGGKGGTKLIQRIPTSPFLSLALVGEVAEKGGAGGGGGLGYTSCSWTESIGGGGGSGGGIIHIFAKHIVLNGNITARGGNGGNAWCRWSTSTPGQGGGGGGGGFVLLVYKTKTGSGTIDVSGGQGGNGCNGGEDGADGKPGYIKEFQLIY